MKEKKVVAKKKVAKPRIGLDPKGIDKLEKVMLANGKYFYNQHTFGNLKQSECGTELCAAGFAHLLNVGEKKLARQIRDFSRALDEGTITKYPTKCTTDGKVLLGISKTDKDGYTTDNPSIFRTPGNWPDDLEERFEVLYDKPMAQVRQYIRMLRTRANSDGSLTEKGQKRY